MISKLCLKNNIGLWALEDTQITNIAIGKIGKLLYYNLYLLKKIYLSVTKDVILISGKICCYFKLTSGS